MPFKTLLQKTGLVAILRGVKPDEIVAIGEKLYAAGFRLIEIPMNSPEALQSISLLRDALPKDCLVGAGTVLSVEQVVAVKEAGGQIIVMPHCDTAVIRRARALGMYCAPGVATPTEAFAAIEHGWRYHTGNHGALSEPRRKRLWPRFCAISPRHDARASL